DHANQSMGSRASAPGVAGWTACTPRVRGQGGTKQRARYPGALPRHLPAPDAQSGRSDGAAPGKLRRDRSL
ncbi:MAG: hypothetical protein AVDCRST_MAG26-2794, partial [uncultured Chloroflexia bacterium]